MSLFPIRLKRLHSKMKALEWSHYFSHCKSMGMFSNGQGQLTPQSMVGTGVVSDSSETFWLVLLPAKVKTILLKIKALECSQH